ncbi:signal peptidase II [Klebsiella pneumoniae subsp. pneumoniae]|nr:signal peptidase II [Klebsiella pneumoniae subsp. pneumoniae]
MSNVAGDGEQRKFAPMSKSICSTGLRWLWVVVAVLIIDLGSKFLILQNFALGRRFRCSPSLNLHYARNYGAAFGFLADSGGWQRWFFSGIAIGICVVPDGADVPFEGDAKAEQYCYALIIGGALGNLFDRLWHGFVVDMIDFYVGDWHFATFNLADSAICIGAALIVLEGFLPKPTVKEQA